MNQKNESVKSCYQGIFVTQTVLGNPNGSFVGNEPRNINGRVFTTDKCIKYNVRNYIHQNHEEIVENDEGEIKGLKNFVFFYPRKSEAAKKKTQKAEYIPKDAVFDKFFKERASDDEDPFMNMLEVCPDVRMFGGTFSFESSKLEEDEGQLYGSIQLSYGLDIIGADIIHLKLGTPFATKKRGKKATYTKEGKQTTTAEEYGVDHAVIPYDITINPKNSPGLLKRKDLELFKEGLIQGTNLRRSTSKKTESKLLILVKFKEGASLNVGELKHLIEVESGKITDPREQPKKLTLNLERVKNKLEQFEEYIEQIDIYTDENTVEIKNFYDVSEEKVNLYPLSTFVS